MRQVLIVFFALAAIAFGQTGRITGTVTDDSGGPVAGALVTASLRSAVPPGTSGLGGLRLVMPFPPKTPSAAKGDSEIDGLLAGTYTLCVEKPESSMLNPCLWLDKPVNVNVAAGATVSSVSVVEPKGIILTVRVQDTKGVLSSNPAADLRIGAYNTKSHLVPARVSGRDGTGKTMAIVVPPGQAVNLPVSSAAFALADDKGKALTAAETQVPVGGDVVTRAATVPGAASPAFTVQVTGAKAGQL